MRSKSLGKISACSVTSRPLMMTGMPLRNTMSAASGSARMLNSAAGVQLPWEMPPPMMLMRAIFSFNSGWASSRAAALVSGPVTTRVTGSLLSRRTRAISSTAGSPLRAMAGSGSTGPSRPDWPWTEGAFMGFSSRGAGRPLATGAVMPKRVQIRRAL